MRTASRPRRPLAGLLLAAGLLFGCGHDSAETDRLLRDLRSTDPTVIDAAEKALVGGGPKVWSDLVDRLESKEPFVASNAGHALSLVDVRSVAPKLRVMLKSVDPRARFWAAVDLAGLDLDDAHLVPYLTEGLYLDEVDPKNIAMVYLADSVKPEALGAEPRLIEGLRLALLFRVEDRQSGVMNSFAAKALARIGKPGLPALISALQIPHADWWAIGALGEMGPVAADAVPALTAIANQPDPKGYRESIQRSEMPARADSAEFTRISQLREKASEALRKIKAR